MYKGGRKLKQYRSTLPKLWNTVKAGLKGKSITLNIYIKKKQDIKQII